MSISAAGAAFRADTDANVIVRIQEEFFGPNSWVGGNQPPPQKYTGPEVVDSANRPSILGNNALGTGGTGIDINGRRFVQVVSGAGVNFRRGGTPTLPMSQEFQTAGISVQSHLKSYLYELSLVRFTLQGAAVWNMCLEDADGGFRLTLTRPGVGWVCDPAINAGRLTPMSRRINGAAMTVGPDSGVTLLNQFHRLGIRYVEGATQRIEFLIDGAVRHTLSGDASCALVNPGGGTQSPFWTPEYGWGITAGSTAQYGPALYEVRNL